MKTDIKQLEISEEIAITAPYVIKIIKELCPAGATYANRVMELAANLSDALDSFYPGSLISDYGCYPFLIVKEYHYAERNLWSDPVIVNSKFNMESFNEWMDCLSISASIRDMIKNEVCVSYKAFQNDGSLDMTYIKVLVHLIQTFNCLQKDYNNARNEIEMMYKTPIGMHRHVSLTCALTLSYLMKKVKRFNQKDGAASGKHLLVLKVGSSDNQVIVSCEKYNKK